MKSRLKKRVESPPLITTTTPVLVESYHDSIILVFQCSIRDSIRCPLEIKIRFEIRFDLHWILWFDSRFEIRTHQLKILDSINDSSRFSWILWFDQRFDLVEIGNKIRPKIRTMKRPFIVVCSNNTGSLEKKLSYLESKNLKHGRKKDNLKHVTLRWAHKAIYNIPAWLRLNHTRIFDSIRDSIQCLPKLKIRFVIRFGVIQISRFDSWFDSVSSRF